MGIANSFSDSQYLLYHIERNEYDKISALLDKKPELINASLTKNSKMTPLYKAAYNGSLKMVQYFIEDRKADVNKLTQTGESPLMAAVKRNHIKVVRYLLSKGANADLIAPSGLSTLDFAILPGFYQIALTVHEKAKKTLIKSSEEYQQLANTYIYRYVDYQIFLNNLLKKIESQNVPDFFTRPKMTYRDPVVDPRQNWKQWTVRQIKFQDPPLVQRDELPQQLRPQNQRFGRAKHFMSTLVMSSMVDRKPTFRPSQSAIRQLQSNKDLHNNVMQVKIKP